MSVSHTSDTGRSQYVNERLDAFTQRCRDQGLSLTPQRIAIIEALVATDTHPAAEEVFAEVRRTYPHISLATVHRTLELLCDLGEARKVTSLHTAARYDGNLQPHHHLVCVECQRVMDVDVPEAEAFFEGLKKTGAHTYLGCALEIHVVCDECGAHSSPH